jgi:hypothetical protein
MDITIKHRARVAMYSVIMVLMLQCKSMLQHYFHFFFSSLNVCILKYFRAGEQTIGSMAIDTSTSRFWEGASCHRIVRQPHQEFMPAMFNVSIYFIIQHFKMLGWLA